MNATWVAWFTFAGTTLLVGATLTVIYDVFFRYRASVRQRIQEVAGKPKGQDSTSLLDIKQLAKSASQAPGQWRTWAHDLIDQSGLRVEIRTLLVASASLGAALAVGAVLAIGNWWPATVGLVAGIAIPWLYVLARRRLRIRRLTSQLPDVLDVMCRAVRSGQTVPAAIQVVADDFPPPVCEEFRHCHEQQNLGVSYDAALRSLACRSGIMELKILVVALLVQSRSGGGLTELLQNLATTVRKRLVLKQKVRALTGEGRLQAAVLIALPFAVFLAIFVLNREYAQVLLDRPWMLAGCATSQAIGAALIHKLIQIDY